MLFLRLALSVTVTTFNLLPIWFQESVLTVAVEVDEAVVTTGAIVK
jgi:hypothetical protein